MYALITDLAITYERCKYIMRQTMSEGPRGGSVCNYLNNNSISSNSYHDNKDACTHVHSMFW